MGNSITALEEPSEAETKECSTCSNQTVCGTKEQKFLHCPGTKGQAQNLAKGRDGTAKIWDGTSRDSQNLGRDAGQ